MDLVYYCRLDKLRNYEITEFNFSLNHRFHISIQEISKTVVYKDPKVLKVHVEKNNTINDFWDGKNRSVSLFVGANGSGKSSQMKTILKNVSTLPFFTGGDQISYVVLILRKGEQYYVKHPENLKIEFDELNLNIKTIPPTYNEDETIQPDMETGSFSCIWFSNTFNLHQLEEYGNNVHDLSLDSDMSRKRYIDFRLAEFKSILDFSRLNLVKDVQFPKEFSFGIKVQKVSNRNILNNNPDDIFLLKILHDRFEKEDKSDVLGLGFEGKLIQFKEMFLWGLLAKFLKEKMINNVSSHYDFSFLKTYKFKENDSILSWFHKGKSYEDIISLLSKIPVTAQRTVFRLSVDVTNPFIIYSEGELKSNRIRFTDLISRESYSIKFQIDKETSFGKKGLDYLIDELLPDYSQLNGLPFLAEYLDFSFPKLSTGEYYLLRFYSKLYSNRQWVNMNMTNLSEEGIDVDLFPYYSSSSLLIFLDEVDIGYHPAWQKKLVSILLSNIPKVLGKSEFQLILSTHSPILTSDIPSQCVTYMENHKPIIKDVQTLGANIHTLYKDSFFLEGGLIGEFANKKIQQVIDWLRLKEYELVKKTENEKRISKPKISEENLSVINDWEKEEVKQRIHLIGEPIVKKNLFERFYYVTKDNSWVEKIIEDLQKYKGKGDA